MAMAWKKTAHNLVVGIRFLKHLLNPNDDLYTDDYDKVMGYSTPQRLLREQMKEPNGAPSDASPSIASFGVPM